MTDLEADMRNFLSLLEDWIFSNNQIRMEQRLTEATEHFELLLRRKQPERLSVRDYQNFRYKINRSA